MKKISLKVWASILVVLIVFGCASKKISNKIESQDFAVTSVQVSHVNSQTYAGKVVINFNEDVKPINPISPKTRSRIKEFISKDIKMTIYSRQYVHDLPFSYKTCYSSGKSITILFDFYSLKQSEKNLYAYTVFIKNISSLNNDASIDVAPLCEFGYESGTSSSTIWKKMLNGVAA